MALDYIEGWEPLATGNLSSVGVGYGYTSSGTITINAAARNGSKCLRINGGSTPYVSIALASATRRGFGCAYKFGVSPGWIGNWIIGFTTGAGHYIGVALEPTNNRLIMVTRVGSTTTQIDTGTTILNVDVYYYVEIDYNSSTGQYYVYLNDDGTQDPANLEMSGTSLSGTTIVSNNYGRPWSASGAIDQYFDDCYSTDDGTLYGDCAADYRFPTADGANQDWTPASGVDGWDMLDNVPVNASEYVEAATAADVSDFDFSGMAVTAYQVYGVMLAVNWLRTGATIETARTHVNVGGSVYSGSTVTVPQTTAEWVRQIWENNPDTGVAWTPSEIQSAFDAGIERVS